MKRFAGKMTNKNYRELLAHERSETERLFSAKILAREEAKIRRRPARERAVRTLAKRAETSPGLRSPRETARSAALR
jgi:hypothetical protein